MVAQIGTVAVAPEFGYVLLSIVMIALECVIEGACVMGARKAAFGDNAFQESEAVQALIKQHKGGLMSSAKDNSLENIEWDVTGYPDMGNGQIGQLLPYPKWHAMARAMRAHYNALEGLPTAITVTVVAGIALPVPAACFGFAIFLGRILYGIGYRRSGAKGRFIGVALIDVSLLALLGMSIYSCLRVAGVVA